MAKEKDESKGSTDKLKQENMELVQALEKISEICTNTESPTTQTLDDILKIVEDTLEH